MMTNLLRRTPAARRALTGVVAGAALSMGVASAHAAPATSQVSLTEWSKMVWLNAEAGNQDLVFNLLDHLPKDHPDPVVESLRSEVDRRNEHIVAREQTRVERLAELRTEINDHLASSKLDDALIAAVEMQDLVDNSKEFLQSDQTRRLISEAEAAAQKAEQDHEWLRAQALYYRLNLLFENQRRYQENLEQLSQRLAFLRLYTPERLHELRDQERIRAGKDPLPPYNPLGDSWEERLRGIDRFMVTRALARAADSNVDGVGMGELIVGGLQNVRTLLGTEDLKLAFPALGNNDLKHRFIAEVDTLAKKFEQRANAGTFELRTAVSGLLQANSATLNLPEQAVLQAFGDGAMLSLDEFSAVIWPHDLAQFMRSTSGRFQGVGIQISIDEAGNLEVVTPIEGTPAQRGGIKRGDIVRRVDGESTLGISLIQAVERITGPAGSAVTLGVEREGHDEIIDIRLVRAEIPIYTVKGWERNGAHETDWEWFIDKDSGIGYIRLTQFSEDTTREFDAAIRAMQRDGLNGLILDLRFNPGGLLTQAVGIANRFVDDGVIVSQHDARGFVTDKQSARRGFATLQSVPTAVLVNEGSASASEIVAGVLQDYSETGRVNAVLVGATTYGKGSVQNLYDLANGDAALKLTTQYYKLPGGRLIHRRPGVESWGVQPDIEVKMLPKQVGKALELRQDADIIDVDTKGNIVVNPDRPSPNRLLTEGLDPQLETALLLLKSRIVGQQQGHAMIDMVEAPAVTKRGS